MGLRLAAALGPSRTLRGHPWRALRVSAVRDPWLSRRCGHRRGSQPDLGDLGASVCRDRVWGVDM